MHILFKMDDIARQTFIRNQNINDSGQTRGQRVRSTQFPENSTEHIIVKANSDGYGFSENFSKNDSLKNISIREPLVGLVKRINKKVQQIYMEKRRLEGKNLLNQYSWQLAIVAVCIILGLALMVASQTVENTSASSTLAWIGIATMAVVCVTLSVISVSVIKSDIMQFDIDSNIEKAVNCILADFNSKNEDISVNAESGMRWLQVNHPPRKLSGLS